MSFLMPTAVRPAVGLCGTYVAVGSSDGEKALSGITQVSVGLKCGITSRLFLDSLDVIRLSIILFCDARQVLMNVLSSRKNMSDSLAYGRLHPHLLPNMLLVDCELSLTMHPQTNIAESLFTVFISCYKHAICNRRVQKFSCASIYVAAGSHVCVHSAK